MPTERVKKELIEMCNYINGNIERRRQQYEALNMAIEALKQLEIEEDVAPIVHAKWIKYIDGIWECSHCGAYITKDINKAFPQYYCRGCGAKMGEE